MAEKDKKIKKIMMSGGGTGGSVAPLLAIYDELKNDNNFEFCWLGTKDGIEREMLKNKDIKYFAIAAGKFRRYWSWQNLIDLARIKIGFWQALFILIKEQPDIVVSAGGFVSVPVVWAGWCLRVPSIIHQQDARPGLANRLMAPLAKIITTTFEKSTKDYGQKARWIGNPIRLELIENKVSKMEAYQKLGLKNDCPTLLVLGGGTGAMAINQLIANNLNELTKFCQIVHVTGKDKAVVKTENSGYHSFEFLDTFGLIKVLAAADVVVSRCGMNVLTELSYFSKATILIPMPDSHQEENAKVFAANNAAIVLDQNKITDQNFVRTVHGLINNKTRQDELGINIQKVIKRGANQELVEVIKKIISNASVVA